MSLNTFFSFVFALIVVLFALLMSFTNEPDLAKAGYWMAAACAVGLFNYLLMLESRVKVSLSLT